LKNALANGNSAEMILVNKEKYDYSEVERVFITNVKGTFLGMSESEEASKRR